MYILSFGIKEQLMIVVNELSARLLENIIQKITKPQTALLVANIIRETKSKGKGALSSPWTTKFRMSFIKGILCLLLKREN